MKDNREARALDGDGSECRMNSVYPIFGIPTELLRLGGFIDIVAIHPFENETRSSSSIHFSLFKHLTLMWCHFNSVWGVGPSIIFPMISRGAWHFDVHRVA